MAELLGTGNTSWLAHDVQTSDEKRNTEHTGHPVHLLLVCHHLLGVQMLHGSMGVGGAGRHSSHESAGANLGAGAGDT